MSVRENWQRRIHCGDDREDRAGGDDVLAHQEESRGGEREIGFVPQFHVRNDPDKDGDQPT